MKVHASAPIVATAATQKTSSAKPTVERSAPVDRVVLSDGARALQTVRDAAKPADLRPEVVDDIRAQLADGSFEANTDWESLAGSLWFDL